MTAELVDEPELVQAVAKIAAQLEQPLARQVIDLCSSCFDAGYANGVIAKFVARAGALDSIQRAGRIVTMHFAPPEPEEPFR